YPIGPDELEDRKEKHIDHLSVKPWRRRSRQMVVQQDPVKGAVNHIADCATQYQRHAPQEARVHVPLRHSPQVISYRHHRPDTKYRKRQFPELIVPPEPEGHTRVQEVVKPEPIPQYVDLLVQVHIVIDQHFRHLIDYDHQKRKQKVPGYLHFCKLIFTFNKYSSNSTGIPSGTCCSRLRATACVSVRMYSPYVFRASATRRASCSTSI